MLFDIYFSMPHNTLHAQSYLELMGNYSVNIRRNHGLNIKLDRNTHDQLKRASFSIMLNIAEGTERSTKGIKGTSTSFQGALFLSVSLFLISWRHKATRSFPGQKMPFVNHWLLRSKLNTKSANNLLIPWRIYIFVLCQNYLITHGKMTSWTVWLK